MVYLLKMGGSFHGKLLVTTRWCIYYIYNYIAMEMYPRVIYNYIYYIAIIIITINYIYYIQWFSQISPVSRWLQSRGAKNLSLFSVHSGGRAIAERLATIVQVPIEPTTHADLNFKHRLSNKKPWFIIVPIGSMVLVYMLTFGVYWW